MPPGNVIIDDISSFIEKLNPKSDINPLCLQLLGLEENYKIDGANKIVTIERKSRPFFSEEFVAQIRYLLNGYLNNLTAFSKYSDEDINYV